jgi:hydroxyacylglutathione hydrolase
MITTVPIRAFTDNYIWVLWNQEPHEFACVDPGDAKPVLEFAKTHQCQLKTILLTHHHDDHQGGVAELMRSYPDCAVLAPEDARIPYATQRVTQDTVFSLFNLDFRVLFNPGHTSSHISYFEPNKQWLFCGDTLFSIGCGRVFDGTIEELHDSLMMFKQLPQSTQIFCAHEYTLNNVRFAKTVEPNNAALNAYELQLLSQSPCMSLPSLLQNELAMNPFLRTDNHHVQQYTLKHGAKSLQSFEVFRILRAMKDIY